MNNTPTQSTMTAFVLATALGATPSMTGTPVAAAEEAGKERCYGVALKGKNDCKAGPGTSCAGTAKVDYQGNTWKYVPQGTCEKTASPKSPTGNGQLREF